MDRAGGRGGRRRGRAGCNVRQAGRADVWREEQIGQARGTRRRGLSDLEDAVLLVGHPEVLTVGRLRRAEKQDAARTQGVAEHAEDLLLRFAVERDQEVPARHEVEPRKRWIAEEVVRGEQHAFAQLLRDAVLLALVAKEPVQALLGDVGGDGARVTAVARDGERAFVEVRGEDLHARSYGAAVRLLEQ